MFQSLHSKMDSTIRRLVHHIMPHRRFGMINLTTLKVMCGQLAASLMRWLACIYHFRGKTWRAFSKLFVKESINQFQGSTLEIFLM